MKQKKIKEIGWLVLYITSFFISILGVYFLEGWPWYIPIILFFLSSYNLIRFKIAKEEEKNV